MNTESKESKAKAEEKKEGGQGESRAEMGSGVDPKAL